LSAGVAALGNALFASMEVVLQLLTTLISFAVITALFAMLYKVLPNAKTSWRDVWVGAAITALLFEIGKFLIGLYIGKSSVASSFGAAGPFVVLMLWIYYSTQIFLLGAEFTVAYSARRNPQRQPERQPNAAPDAGSAGKPNVPGSSNVPAAAGRNRPAPVATYVGPEPPGGRVVTALALGLVVGAAAALYIGNDSEISG
jgi:membrane protein